LVANALVFRWSDGGVAIKPLRTVTHTEGVGQLNAYLARLWCVHNVPTVFGVVYGGLGLLGIPVVGIGLLLASRRFRLSEVEALFVCLFVVGLPPLFLFGQSGLSHLFLVFFGAVP